MSDRAWNEGVEWATFIVLGLLLFAVGFALAFAVSDDGTREPEDAVHRILGE